MVSPQPFMLDDLESQFEHINPGESSLFLARGIYPGRYLRKQTASMVFKGCPVEKMTVFWEVFTDTDLSQSIVLPRYYNLKRDAKGNLVFGPRHDYFKDWVSARKGKWPLDRRKLPLHIFKDGLFLLSVTTVTRDSKRDLPQSLWSSRIDYLLRPVEENEKFDSFPLQEDETK